MLSAVLSDYSHEKSRGRVSGIVGVFSGLGAIIGALLLSNLPTMIDRTTIKESSFKALEISFIIAAVLSVITAAIVVSFLKSAPKHFRSKKKVLEMAYEGLTAIKKPEILLAYAGGFAARADSVLVPLFIPLWVNKYFIETGVCSQLDDACPAGTKLAASLTGVSQVFALLGAPLYGHLTDKVHKTVPIFLAGVIGTIGFGLFTAFEHSPTSGLVYALVILAGVAQIGMIVTSLSLLAANCDESVRGSVAGYYSVFGGIGILVSTKLGGVLFDKWTETGPFLLLCIYHAAISVFSGILYLRRRTGQIRLSVDSLPSE
jgi:MFS family permease